MNLVAHQRRTGMAVHHLLHRAAEVDVDDRRAAIFVELGGLGHHLGLAAGQLHRHGELLRGVPGHQERLAVLPYHGCRGDHLGHDQAGAAALDHLAERHVGDTRHRGQDDGIFDPDRADIDRAETGCMVHTCDQFIGILCSAQ